MSWQLLLGISIVTYVVSQILQRVLLKEKTTDPMAFAIVFQFMVGALIGMYAIMQGSIFPSNLVLYVPNMILMTILYGGGNIFLYKSLKIIPISEFAILFSTSTLWTIVGAVLLLGERFSTLHFVGTILIMMSLVITFKTSKKFHLFGHGQTLCLIAAAMFGLAFVNDAYVLKDINVNYYVSMAFILPAIGLLAIYPKARFEMKIFLKPSQLKKMLIIVVFYATSAITIFTAYTVGQNAAVISVLNKTSSLLIVLAGIVFLNERENVARKVVGASIALLGVALLIL
jgi:drug/metabolite transporter (DMT)-like permease